MRGDTQLIRLLHDFGADPSALDDERKTPLEQAERRGNKYAANLLREYTHAPANGAPK